MSYSAPYLDEGGIHLPTYSERLEDLLAGYRRIFGEDVYIGEDTMDYQLLSIVAKCWDDLNSLILDSYNARNPNLATGTALDMLLPLNGIRRESASPSSCVLKLTGVAGKTLEAGIQAMDEDGHIWEVPEEVTFGQDGTVEVTAWCTQTGAISAGIGTINTINTPVQNWYAVTNEVEATLGRDVETDAAVRKRRSLSVSLPSRSVLSGIRAALLDISGVVSVNLVENETDTAGEIPAHSICAVVDGGSDEEIARALWLKKSPGCGLYGSEAVTYVDDYDQPNVIHFARPVYENVRVRIHLRTFASFERTLLSEKIPQAVAAHVNALGVGEDLIIGLLNAVIYNANDASYPIFSVVNLTASGNGQTATTDAVEAGYGVRLRSTGDVEITESSPGVYIVEVG